MLEVKNLKKYYKTNGGVEVHALDGVSIQFPEKGMVFLLGKSGSGKSTLLNVSGGLDRPDSGEVIVKGKSSKDFSQSDFDSYRNTFVGFIFQEYNILNEFNVETNISLALELQGKKNDKAAVEKILNQVDMAGMGKRKPNTLSGGQKQRIAIARALIKEPEIIMADEPTGALDSSTGKQVFDTLKKLSQTKLVIIVSHDRDFAEEYADRIIELKDGKVLTDHTKGYSKAAEISTNVKKIGEDTFQIDNVSKMSEEEFSSIFRELKGDGEVIISKNKNNLATFRKVAKISESGDQQCFKDTDLNKVDIKEYNGKETKFIKSTLPMRHAVKMGASNLRIKPLRLIFTIFLSVVSFTMFGTLSTLMFYDPSYSFAKALQDEPYQALRLDKQYICHQTTTRLDRNGVEEDQTKRDVRYNAMISKDDISNLNSNNLNLKFTGFYKQEIEFTNYLKEETNLDYYKLSYFNGICDCGESFLLDQGFTKLAGKYPENSQEIAVSEYCFQIFEKCGFKDPITHSKKIIKDANDMIGLPISYMIGNNGVSTTINATISGVYRLDTSYEDVKYDILKKEDTSSVSRKDYMSIQSSFEDVTDSSFYSMCYVYPNYYNDFKSYLESEQEDIIVNYDYTSMYGLRLYVGRQYDEYQNNKSFYATPDEYDYFKAMTESTLDDGKKYFDFYDIEGNKIDKVASIGSNEIYLNASETLFVETLRTFIYSEDGTEYGYYDRNGELNYYRNPSEGYDFGNVYIDLATMKYSCEEKEGNKLVDEILVGDNGEIIAYRTQGYTNVQGTDYKASKETGFENPCDIWFDKNQNVLGGSNAIKEVYVDYFLVDEATGNAYVSDDAEYIGDSYYLKTNHNIKLTTVSGSYYLDQNGKITSNDYNNQPKVGLFVNPSDLSMSITKKDGYVFTDKYYKDNSGNVYFGQKTAVLYIDTMTTNDNVFATYGVPLGGVDMKSYIVRNKTYVESYPEAAKSLARYFFSLGDTYSIQQLAAMFPEISFENVLKQKMNSDDISTIIQAIKNANDNSRNSYLNFPEKVEISSYDGTDAELNVKGFFFTSKKMYWQPYAMLSDYWLDKLASPDYGNEYTWIEKTTTKYVIDPNAQYDGAICLSNNQTNEISFMRKTYDDDSVYEIRNRIMTELSLFADLAEKLEIVFLIVGVIMAVFSALMLFNFIATSISAKNKEIGILRAVGARGSDVFKIYFAESGIICFICFILSSIASAILCLKLNDEVSSILTLQVFNFGLLNIACILGVALVVGFVGTIFPVVKASRKPPVESIRAL